MKKLYTFLLFVFLIALLTGCAGPDSGKNTGETVTFQDALGHTIAVSEPSSVIAASGSFAQIWKLAGGTLVGTTEDALQNDPGLSDNAANIGKLHSPSLESILALNPDLVILSADIGSHTSLYEQLAAARISTAYFSVEQFEDYLDMLRICTDITGREDLYVKNGLSLQKQIQEILGRVQNDFTPKILLLRAGAGKVTARNSSTMAGTMLKDMGCINIADSETGLLENLSMEVIIREDPDFIFFTTMGDSTQEAKDALEDMLLSNPAWENLSAVKNNRYIMLPKELFHQKPNNLWPDAYEILWGILYGKS